MGRSARRNDPALPFPTAVPDPAAAVPPSSLLAHVRDLVAVIDANGDICAVSGAVERQLGHRSDRLIGGPISQLFVADPEKVPTDVLDRVFLGRGSHGPLELLALDADGRPRVVEATIENRLEWNEGGPDASGGVVVVTAVDLTERRMVDATLAEQRSLLELIARGASVEEAAERTVERLGRWLPDAGAAILGTDHDGCWRVLAAEGLPDALARVLHGTEGRSPIGQALSRLSDEVTPVTLGDPNWFAVRGACRSSGVESFWARPFRTGVGTVLSGAVLVIRHDRRPPTEAECDLVDQSAHLAAIAVERHAAVAALEHAAVHDELTGLPNRTLLLDRITHALVWSNRTAGHVGVLFVDLDRFKHVNDTLGHATGDAVLCAVAGRLQGVLRAGDTVGRLGGDEFLMVCPELEEPSDASIVAGRIAEVLRNPVRIGGAELRVRASIGVAVAEGPDATAEDLVRNADHAMYRAKERGRDGVVVFEEADHLRMLSRVEIEQALHGAPERGEMVLHFQPILRLSDRRQVGVEALVRWERPGRGLVHPSDFISVAEETGLIVPLGTWVIEEAFRSALAWPEPLHGGRIRVAVNLSPRQVAAPGLVDRITALFERTGVDPGNVCFEVTESALVIDEDMAVDTLERLKGLGVHIAIDDFGTGHATLDYLRRFTMADELKIDQSFVRGLDRPGGQERAIVSASVSLAHSLGIEVVAEGIETEAQLEAVVELGCDRAQGYLIGPPEIFVEAVGTSSRR